MKTRRGRKPAGVVTVIGDGTDVVVTATVIVVIMISVMVEADRVASTVEQLVDVMSMIFTVVWKGQATEVGTVPVVMGDKPKLVMQLVREDVTF